jgi:hypothetical protein
LLNGFFQAGENGPLYTLVLHFWLALLDAFPLLSRALHAIFGIDYEAPVRALAMLFGTATIPAIYLFARRVGGRSLGLISAVLLTLSPFHVWHSQDAKMYTLLVLATLVSSLLYLVAWERNTWPLWAAYVLSTWVMLTSHSMALLVLLAQLVATPFIRKVTNHRQPVSQDPALQRSERSNLNTQNSWVGWGWAMLLILGPIFPIAWLRAAALITNTADVGGWYAPAGLGDITGTLAVNYAVNRADPLWEWVGSITMGLLVTAGILAIYRPFRQRLPLLTRLTIWEDDSSHTPQQEATGDEFHHRRDARPLLLAMLLIPLLGFWLVTLKIPLFQARYLIMALPAYIVLAGAGILALWRFRPVSAAAPAALLTVASIMALVGVNYAGEPQKEDWRGAMAYVMDRTRLRDVIIVFPGYLSSAVELYYTPGGPGRVPDQPIKTIPSLATEGFGDRELDSTLDEIVKCHERAWLITSPEREAQEDPSHRVRQWLQFNWRTFDTRVFNGVTLYGIAFNGQPDCWFPEPTSPERHTFENGIDFLGYIYELRDNATTQPDASYFPLTLYWHSPSQALVTEYDVRVVITGSDGQVIKDESLPPHNGFWPTTQWPPNTNIIDYRDIRLPGGITPGDYTVTLQLHPKGRPHQPLRLISGATEITFQEPLEIVPWAP